MKLSDGTLAPTQLRPIQPGEHVQRRRSDGSLLRDLVYLSGTHVLVYTHPTFGECLAYDDRGEPITC